MSSRNISREELLIDGYVSHTFCPQVAEAYFSALLMSKPQHIQWHSMPPEGIFYAAAPPCPESNQDDQEAWAIDRAIKHTGRVIPQHIWTPRLSPDVQRYVRYKHYVPQSSSYTRKVEVSACQCLPRQATACAFEVQSKQLVSGQATTCNSVST